VEFDSIFCLAPIALDGARVVARVEHITLGLSLPFRSRRVNGAAQRRLVYNSAGSELQYGNVNEKDSSSN
jgi:hypothetical protein